MSRIATLSTAAAALVLWLGSAAPAQTVMVTLTGDAERPSPVVTDGFGTATVTFDPVTREVSISGSYANMNATVTAAHLHGLADADTTAGILIPLTVDGGLAGDFSGSGTLSVNDFNGFMDDLTYINVHSTAHPAGEIRGQVIIPEPTAGIAALAASGLLLRRRRV